MHWMVHKGNTVALTQEELAAVTKITCISSDVASVLGSTPALAILEICDGRLPDSLGQFTTKLAKLAFRRCRELEAFSVHLTMLTALYIIDCRVTMLPESVSRLVALKTLHIKNCLQLKVLPESVGLLANLRTLDVTECGLTTLPQSVGQLAMLSTLHLSYCACLAELPESLGQLAALTTLVFDGCCQLTRLPNSLGELKLLATTHFVGCRALIEATLGRLTAVTMLDFGSCSALRRLPNELGSMTALKTLCLYFCVSLTELPESLGQLTALTTLNLVGCRRLTMLPESLGQLPLLTTLKLSRCTDLICLPLSFVYLPDCCFAPWHGLIALTFPPSGFVSENGDIKQFLLAHHGLLKSLVLILAARRNNMPHVPDELWVGLEDESKHEDLSSY